MHPAKNCLLCFIAWSSFPSWIAHRFMSELVRGRGREGEKTDVKSKEASAKKKRGKGIFSTQKLLSSHSGSCRALFRERKMLMMIMMLMALTMSVLFLLADAFFSPQLLAKRAHIVIIISILAVLFSFRVWFLSKYPSSCITGWDGCECFSLLSSWSEISIAYMSGSKWKLKLQSSRERLTKWWSNGTTNWSRSTKKKEKPHAFIPFPTRNCSAPRNLVEERNRVDRYTRQNVEFLSKDLIRNDAFLSSIAFQYSRVILLELQEWNTQWMGKQTNLPKYSRILSSLCLRFVSWNETKGRHHGRRRRH